MPTCNGNIKPKLEEMAQFFNVRSKIYDEQQIKNISSGDVCYKEVAKYIPDNIKHLIDIGCGTGLELYEIYRKLPDLQVIGIDLAKDMLDICYSKYKDKNIQLINQNYFNFDFGNERYDAAISVMTLHHFTHEEKIDLYKKILNGLKQNGIYIECDYMVKEQKEEDYYFEESKQIRINQGVNDVLYHIDTPCTVNNQIDLLKSAGFTSVTKVWQFDNTALLVAQKLH